MISRDECLDRDSADPLRDYRRRFVLPPNLIYLDGNSLGPMPHGVQMTVAWHMDIGWGVDLITSWNKHHWVDLPRTIGDAIGRLIGAGNGNTIAGDTISVNLFKVLSAALSLQKGRKIILSDNGNFPSDLYVAQGLSQFLGDGYDLRTCDPEEVEAAISDDVAVVMLTEADYRTGRLHDMEAITKLAHDRGCLVIWDLAHTAGISPIDLMGCDADFAVGCTYKYLNGGPGAPGFVFVHPRHQEVAMPALVGWWGHERPFAFDPDWRAATGIARYQCGTQGVLSMVALDAAMMVWKDVDMQLVRQKSQGLCGLFISLVEEICSSHGLKLAGPRDPDKRGSHVSFSCANGYAVMQALISKGVIGDFRAPDLIRFGFAPLYNTYTEVFDAASTLAHILVGKLWDKPEFLTRKSVT
jgi:kynureninase